MISRTYLGLVLVGLILSPSVMALTECIDDAPKTFDDNEMLEYVKDCLSKETKYEVNYRTMEGLLKGGFLKTADHLLKNHFLKQSVDISGNMKLTIVEMKNKLEYLLKLISQVKKALVTLPVFKWGQSEDSIFIHVKFSHRFDTPGCLDISEEIFEVKDKKLYYQANCMQTHQPINFIIDINLFAEAVEEGKAIRKGSVGTRVLEFKKKVPQIWRNLHDDTEKFSRMQMQVWWDLKDVYPKAMDEYAKLLESDEEDDDEIWEKKPSKKASSEQEVDSKAQPQEDEQPEVPQTGKKTTDEDKDDTDL